MIFCFEIQSEAQGRFRNLVRYMAQEFKPIVSAREHVLDQWEDVTWERAEALPPGLSAGVLGTRYMVMSGSRISLSGTICSSNTILFILQCLSCNTCLYLSHHRRLIIEPARIFPHRLHRLIWYALRYQCVHESATVGGII